MLLPLAAEPSTLQVVWYVLIAVLWIGYFVLEGFDFGVGMLFPVLGRDAADLERATDRFWRGRSFWARKMRRICWRG